MKNIRWIFAAILLCGCAYEIIDIPVASGAVRSQTIRPISRDEISMMQAGNVFIVNTMENYCRDILVFSGHRSLDQLIIRGPDGLPAIDYFNIGRFGVSPASGGIQRLYGEILVGTFMPNQEFTFLITTQSVSDRCRKVVTEPQIYYGRAEYNAFGEKYTHPVGGIMVEEMVCNVVFLPEAHVNQDDTSIISNSLSIDNMLMRGLHKQKLGR